MTDDLPHRIARWALCGEVGLSSRAIARETMGFDPADEYGRINWPHDPADFRRCYELIKAVPEARLAVDRLGEKSPEWAELAARWGTLTAIYEEELMANVLNEFGYVRCPRLYVEMKAAGA